MPKVSEFKNQPMQMALTAMRQEQSNENLLKAANALMNTTLLVPATWDKEPEEGEDGQLKFTKDTRISFLLVSGQDGKKYFPMFTEMDQVRAFYGDQPVTCLILGMPQYMPFVNNPSAGVSGIVIDPKGLDVPFNTEFLNGIFKAATQTLTQNTIRKNQKILFKNIEERIDDLEAALISCGFHEKSVKNIYIKERIEDPEDPTKTHWFIVVDAEDLDTGIFTRIGNKCRPVSHGKEMEFMFANQKLGQDIAKSSDPIYSRM